VVCAVGFCVFCVLVDSWCLFSIILCVSCVVAVFFVV